VKSHRSTQPDRGATITIDRFGASAPAKENFKQFGFTIENIVDHARQLVHK
jgi:transketolase